jgi:molybdopterin molybdotransferase
MIAIDEARRIVLENTRILEPVIVDLADAPGRVLAEDVAARERIPLFDSSSMDGFGVVCSDVAAASAKNPAELPVLRTIQAGEAPGPPVPAGHAVRIMTGAVVPDGVEAVVMKENADDLGGAVRIKAAAGPGTHIRKRGGEFSPGDVVLRAGSLVTPPVTGMLAVLNRNAAAVHPKPSVTLVLTGNELRLPGEELGPGEIRDANSFSLAAALGAMGITEVSIRRVDDDLDATRAALAAALDESNVVISVGGISVGDFDFVKDAAESLGVETLFWRITMKPGKPNYFGKKGEKLLFFGLPGNPVSVLVSFQQLVRPALWKLSGLEPPAPALFMARLTEDITKRDPRLEFVRGRLVRDHGGGWAVRPIRGRESHMLGGLANADCLIHFPLADERLAAGSAVTVEPLRWSEP